MASDALNSSTPDRAECVGLCESTFGLSLTLALHDLLFPFLQLGSIPWSTGQSFSQSPWDFMKKKKVEQAMVLLSGDE